MKMKNFVKYGLKFTGIFFLFIFQPGLGQNVTIRSALESDTILIGDQVHYSLEVIQPVGLFVQLPGYKDTIIGEIEILESPLPDTTKINDETIQILKHFLITSFEEGFYIIPAPKINFEVAAGEKELTGSDLYLQVLTMPVDTSKGIYDIKLPYQAPITFKEVLPYLIGGVVLVAIIILLFYFIRKWRRKRRGFIPFKPKEPPYVIALRELDRLKEDKLWQKNKVKHFHTRLTDILRNYIEGRYDINAMEQTTSEILSSLKTSAFNDNRLFSKLKDILDLADLVKFAKFKPLPQENETTMLDAYIFINETKPVEKLQADESSNVEDGKNSEITDLKASLTNSEEGKQ